MNTKDMAPSGARHVLSAAAGVALARALEQTSDFRMIVLIFVALALWIAPVVLSARSRAGLNGGSDE